MENDRTIKKAAGGLHELEAELKSGAVPCSEKMFRGGGIAVAESKAKTGNTSETLIISPKSCREISGVLYRLEKILSPVIGDEDRRRYYERIAAAANADPNGKNVMKRIMHEAVVIRRNSAA
jgi:hypothetical protein